MIAADAPPALPTLNAFAFDARVLAFCVASTLVAGSPSAPAGAARARRVDPGDALKANSYTTTDGPRGGRARRVLVAAQAAIGVALLVTTGLLVLSFVRLMHVDKGFDTARILTVDVALPAVDVHDGRASSCSSSTRRSRACARCLASTRRALTSRLPLRGESTVNLLSYPSTTSVRRPRARWRTIAT